MEKWKCTGFRLNTRGKEVILKNWTYKEDIKMDLTETGHGCRMDSSGLWWVQGNGCFKHGNEKSSSMNWVTAGSRQSSQEGFYTHEFTEIISVELLDNWLQITWTRLGGGRGLISGTILTFTCKKWQKTISIACFTTEILTRTYGGNGVLITWLWCSAQSCYCHVGVRIQLKRYHYYYSCYYLLLKLNTTVEYKG